MDWNEETFRLTVVLLLASLLLIGPGLAGFGGSLLLVVDVLLVAAGLYAVRDRLATAPEVLTHDLGHYAAALWTSGVVAAAVLLFRLSATPDELVALGGLVGLLGMVNYFLRPVYRLLVVVGRTFFGATA
ncbi:hypothetical protein [Salinibaculum rarum]|uniref:hypothetical protein n=1 Tax=Salinibaculum rarum TaxID=3058903 RepID=UPI00265E54A5|nr:hypothetical protein [Salinibaculum sp. KK48]